MPIPAPLLEFEGWFNFSDEKLPALQAFINQYAEDVAASALRQWVQPDEPKRVRMSEMGKPAVKTAMTFLGYPSDTINNSTHYIFHMGDTFEAFILTAMKAFGLCITHEQAEVTYKNLKGHIDGIYTDLDSTNLVEVKTMSHWYATKFIKLQDDDRGYVTQLALYGMLTDTEPVWCILDKDGSPKDGRKLRFIEPNWAQMQHAIKRVDNILNRLEQLETFADIFKLFRVPPPVAQIRKGVENGKYLLPPSMYGWKYNPVFYKLLVEDTVYVIGENSPAEAYDELQKILDTPEVMTA